MKIIGTYLFILITISSVYAQQSQALYGFVYEQNSGKKPVKGVMVKAGFANQIATTDQGSYTLTFQNARPGKAVVLAAEKEAWIITDKDKLAVNLPDDPFTHPHVIIMCREDLWKKQNADNKAIIKTNLQQAYQKQIATLNKQSKGYQKKLDSLNEQFTQMEKSLDELAEVMSRTNLDEVTEIERKAYQLFKEGKFEKCKELRKSLKSGKTLLRAVNKKKQLDSLKKIIDTASIGTEKEIAFHKRNLKEEIRSAQWEFYFKLAEAKLDTLIMADSTDPASLFEYAYFLQQQNQYDEAIVFYKRVLVFVKTELGIATVQHNLGILYKSKNEYVAAEKAYLEALEIYKRFAKNNPAAYEPYVATTQHNLSVLYKSKNEYVAAEKACLEALKIYKRFAKSNPAVYEPYVATIQNNLGNLYKDKNEYVAAEKAYLEALEIRKRFAIINPAAYEPDVAITQHNLGSLFRDKKEYVAAENAYLEALEIYKRYAKNNPAVYEPDVALTQHNLGILYKDKNEYVAAETAYLEALEIRRRYAKSNPAVYEPDVAATQNNLGNLYDSKNEYAAAEKAYLEALEIYKRFAKSDPAAYESYVAATQHNLGILYKDMKEYVIAESAYLEALEIYKRFAKSNPAIYEPYIAVTQYNLGNLYRYKNEYAAAEKAYLEALEIYRRFAKNTPAAYEPDVATTQNNLGNLYGHKKEYVAAEKAYLEALEIRRRYAKNTPAVYEPYIAETQYNLGLLYAEKKDYVAAEKAYLEALEIYKRFAKSNPVSYEPYVAETQYNLGNLYDSKNDHAAAEKAYWEAIGIYNKLKNINPKKYDIEFCINTVLLGLIYQTYYQPSKLIEYNTLLKAADSVLVKYNDENTLPSNLKKVKNELNSFFLSPDVEIKILKNQITLLKNNKDKLSIQQEIIGKRKTLLKDGHSEFIIALAKDIGGLAWYLIFDKQYAAAEQAAKEVLFPEIQAIPDDYKKETEWINTNLALSLLMQGKYEEAEKIYLTFKDRPYRETTFKKSFLDDLDELEKAGITHKDLAKIRELLNK